MTNPRLAHALRYAAIRSLEMDLGMQRNSLTVNHFEESMLRPAAEKMPRRVAYIIIFPPPRLPYTKSPHDDV